MRVLLSEASSLTAREHLSVLGRAGVKVDVLSSEALPLARLSRWCGKVVRVPAAGEDPVGYLDAVAQALREAHYDALLPTHEQAWLFAAGRHRLPADAPLAVSELSAFDHVQGKVAFCKLLDTLGIAQPGWSEVPTLAAARAVRLPCWMKASFSTAGRGVRHVRTPEEAQRAYAEFSTAAPVLAQQPASGTYAQVAGLFAHGSLIAVHTSEQVGMGAGGSAAARRSVDHPGPRDVIARIGSHLGWHGGLTLDYVHHDGEPLYIEANPRTVEPANAAASGVDFPLLTVALSRGDALPTEPVVGRAGVRTHSTLALMIGAAERTGSRGSVMRVLLEGLAGRGEFRGSSEVLTPVGNDWPSLLPVLVVGARLLRSPANAQKLAAGAVRAYAVPPAAITAVA